jgi:hypothetical protein
MEPCGDFCSTEKNRLNRWLGMLFQSMGDTKKVLRVLLTCCIAGHCAAAQQTRCAPKGLYQQSSPTRVVNIRFSTYGGLAECSPGNELQVSSGEAALLITFSQECHRRDPHRYRDLRVHADVSGKHWQAIQRLIDHDALFAVPDRTGCASCVDGIDEMIEVKFSDHTNKSVTFPLGSAPKEISALSENLLSLESKLWNELPNGVSNNRR